MKIKELTSKISDVKEYLNNLETILGLINV